LTGFAIYELVLYPAAGFPTEDFSVVVRGADTLRVGHYLKFGYAIGLTMIVVGLHKNLSEKVPMAASLAAIVGAGGITLFIASGTLGLNILNTAQALYATKPDEAITTILLRTVTISLFAAGGFMSGWYLLLICIVGLQTAWMPGVLSWAGIPIAVLHILDMFLHDELRLIAPLATIAWALALAFVLWRSEERRVVQEIATG
jgi:hypothetical protein